MRPIPESLEFEAQRDPTIETLRELRMTSEFSKAVITKTNITRMAKFNQYKVTTIFEDYFSEIAEYGWTRFLEDQDLKEIITGLCL